MATKKQIRKAMKGDEPMNAMYRLIPENKRSCFACFARIFGYSRADIKQILECECTAKRMNMQEKIRELMELLEEHLPPHLIEEVRGRILDIIQTET